MAGIPEHGLVPDESRGGEYATVQSVTRMIRVASIISTKALDGPAFDPKQQVTGDVHGTAFNGLLDEETARHCKIAHLAANWPRGAVNYLTGITVSGA